jgi:hypothetical protein
MERSARWLTTDELSQAKRDAARFKVATNSRATPGALAMIFDQHQCILGLNHDEAVDHEIEASDVSRLPTVNGKIPLSVLKESTRKWEATVAAYKASHPAQPATEAEMENPA